MFNTSIFITVLIKTWIQVDIYRMLMNWVYVV